MFTIWISWNPTRSLLCYYVTGEYMSDNSIINEAEAMFSEYMDLIIPPDRYLLVNNDISISADPMVFTIPAPMIVPEFFILKYY